MMMAANLRPAANLCREAVEPSRAEVTTSSRRLAGNSDMNRYNRRSELNTIRIRNQPITHQSQDYVLTSPSTLTDGTISVSDTVVTQKDYE